MNWFLRIKQAGGKRRWGYLLGTVILFFTGLLACIAIVPAVFPSTGAQIADLIRATSGPQVAADIETVSFRIQDIVQQILSTYNGGKTQITLSQPTASRHVTRRLRQVVVVKDKISQGPAIPAPTNVVTAGPQIGWQAYGPAVNGSPVMAQALLTLDPQRPYAGIALVRIDLSKLQLHMMPGFLEPSHTQSVVNAIPNIGQTPAADLKILVAAFNGGFKAINGQYGMMVDGVTLLPPIPGIATVAIYQDGSVRIGAWGQDILPSANLVAFRQNCPLVLQNGQLNPQVSIDNRMVWGQTIGNQEITWRTGLGITQDGRYLIYAVGNATTTQTLAQSLQIAGAYNAMQLDINRHYAHFVTYRAAGGSDNSLQAVQLLNQMENDPTIYLVAHSRDYFYLTTR